MEPLNDRQGHRCRPDQPAWAARTSISLPLQLAIACLPLLGAVVAAAAAPNVRADPAPAAPSCASATPVEARDSLHPVRIGARTVALPASDDVGPVPGPPLTTDDFQLAAQETSRCAFAAFINANGYSTQEWWSPEGWAWREKLQVEAPLKWDELTSGPDTDWSLPVTGVSFYEAEAFARWVGGRLPSETEWEAALRGPDGLSYGWGSTWDKARANTADSGRLALQPVGETSATPDGVEDMIGSAWEWTDTPLDDYPGYPLPQDMPASMHALRGGSFWDRDWGKGILPRLRNFQDAGYRQTNIGFRVAFDEAESAATRGVKAQSATGAR